IRTSIFVPLRSTPARINRAYSTNTVSGIWRAPISAGFEEGKHGEYSSIGVGGSGDPELAEDVLDVLLDGALGYPEGPCDCGIGASLRHEFDDVPLPRRQGRERVWPFCSPEQVDDELGVKNDLSFADPLEGIEQLVDVGDGVLEQVADTIRRPREEADCLVHFHVAREEQ